MGGLERLLDDVGFVPKPSFNVENLAFHSFWNLSMRTHALGFSWPFFSKNCLFNS